MKKRRKKIYQNQDREHESEEDDEKDKIAEEEMCNEGK